MNTSNSVIRIQFCRTYQEYAVPTMGKALDSIDFYFTDDREDAINTAMRVHGNDADINITQFALAPANREVSPQVLGGSC